MTTTARLTNKSALGIERQNSKQGEGEHGVSPVTELKTSPDAVSESASANGGALATRASAKTTRTGAVFGATPGMPGIFKSNFDYQLARGASRGKRHSELDCRMERARGEGRGHSRRLPERLSFRQCARGISPGVA